MNEKIATPVVKNKFWVVESSGQKIATIQARDDGGYVYVNNKDREYFTSFKLLKDKYRIKIESKSKSKLHQLNNVYGYPIIGKCYNQAYDVVRKLPVYTKTLKSKSLFCAGYYLINFNNSWNKSFCPKNITISRYQYHGPFKTEDEMNTYYRENL